MTKRLRLVEVIVRPRCFVDDGDTLSELEVQPVVVPWNQWEAFVESGFAHALGQLREQVEGSPEP